MARSLLRLDGPPPSMGEIFEIMAERKAEFGFFGDAETPVQVEIKPHPYVHNSDRLFKDGKMLTHDITHAIMHAHDGDRCIKNKFGDRCND